MQAWHPRPRATPRLGAIALVIAVALAHGAAAQQPVAPDVAGALGYLQAQQQGDGSYGSPAPLATDYQTTARVAQSLYAVPAAAPGFTAARAFLAGQAPDTTEQRARRLLVDPASPDTAGLLGAQAADGGFGSDTGFASNVLDTALALVALRDAGQPVGIVARDVVVPAAGSETFVIDVPADGLTLEILVETLAGAIEVRIGAGAPPSPTDPYFPIAAGNTIISIHPTSGIPLVPGESHFVEISSAAGATTSFTIDFTATSGGTAALTAARAFLQDARNADGGWGFQHTDDNSQLYYTYWAVRALETVDAAAFALARQIGGGGFGDAGVANVFDTALGLSIVALAGQDPEVAAPQSIAYLEGSQVGGGFDDDPFRTAWAIDALLASRAPLAPVITTNGGAGAGVDFVTDLAQITITGIAPVGSSGVSVNVGGAQIVFDAQTGAYAITLSLAVGANSIVVSATNTAGVAGPTSTLVATFDPSLTGQDIALDAGFNTVGLALDPANPLDAIALLELIGPAALELQRFDPLVGAYESVSRDGSGGFVGSNFTLGSLDGVNVINSAPAAARIVGSPSGTTTIDLGVGANVLTIPNPPAGLDAFGLLGLLGDDATASALQGFDRDSGAFETAVYAGGVPAGANFPIVAGAAYLASMRQGVTGFALPVALGVAITSPTEGAVLTSSPVTVTGTVSGVPPLAVDVNGVAATVVGGTFSADVPLSAGANALTAQATDAVSAPVTDVVNVTLQAVDYTIAAGGFVQDSRVISADASVIAQVASIGWSFVGLPPEVAYNVTGVFIISSTQVQVDFQIDIAGGAAPGIYGFQVLNQLLDGGSMPLGPLTGDVFDFQIEVTP